MNNLLLHCDAVALLEALSSQFPKAVDLVYIDPPFNIGACFTARTRPKERRSRTPGAESPVAYRDRWGGIHGFLDFLEPVLSALRTAMSPNGVLWLHLDHRTVHEAKVLCDRAFGRRAFRGEVIWGPGNGPRGKRGPCITHETLLICASCPQAELVWNSDDPALRESYAATSLQMHFRRVDQDGRRYRDRTVGGKTYRYYADQGRRLGSVWTDIPAMVANTPIHAEGTGYPTQKPEKLLERIVLLSSAPGALVCDPMCGSGTTLAVAGRLGRRFVGCDTSALAIELAAKRLCRDGLRFATTM